jgi:hypothetical protein
MAVAASLNVLLTAQTAAFQAGMKKAEATTKQFQSVMGKAQATLTTFKTAVSGFAAAVGASKLASSYVDVLNKFDDTADAADRLGVKFQELKAIQDASLRGGLEVSGITDNLEKLSLTLGKARQGSEQAQEAFANIGLGAAVTGGGNSASVFFQVVDSLRAIDDSSKRAALSSAIFGKNQKELLTLLSAAPAVYDQIRASMMDVSGQASDAMVQSLSRQVEYVNNLKASWENAKIAAIAYSGMAVEAAVSSSPLQNALRAEGLLGGSSNDMLKQREQEVQAIADQQAKSEQAAANSAAFVQAEVRKTVESANRMAEVLRQAFAAKNRLELDLSIANIRKREEEEKRMAESRGRVNFFTTLAGGVMAAADKAKIDAAKISPAAASLSAGSHANQLFEFNRSQADRSAALLKKPADKQAELLQRIHRVLEKVAENTKEQDKVLGFFGI